MAAGAIINGKLNFENTANVGDMTDQTGDIGLGLLVSCKVTVRF